MMSFPISGADKPLGLNVRIREYEGRNIEPTTEGAPDAKPIPDAHK